MICPYLNKFTNDAETKIKCFDTDVGGNQRRDTDGMVIYVGEGGGGMFNTPYFDQEMVSNYTVQVRIIIINSA